MIKSLSFSDFKCFVDVEVADLRRFNVLVGQSGSGKTAFLEGLFLAAGGSLELYFRTRKWRGYDENIEVSASHEVYESMGRELICMTRGVDAAYLKFYDPDVGQRSLRIARKSGGSQRMLINPRDVSVDLSQPVEFRWTLGSKHFESRLEFAKDGMRVRGNAPTYTAVFLTPASLYHRETIRRFSALSKRGNHHPLVEAIKDVFHEVTDISIEMDLGKVSLYATLDGMPEKLPLSAISSGLHKYIAIAAAIVSQPRGVVLVDEIENGFYYKNMKPLLKSLYSLAEEHSVQVFASTHSYELLQAMASVMKDESNSDFALLRLEHKGAMTAVSSVSGAPAVEAINQSFEVR